MPRLAGQTPAQARQTSPDGRVRTLPADLIWTPGTSLPLVAGRVHSVRLTDSQGRLVVFGRPFSLGLGYRRTYIRATLTVARQEVSFYYQETPEEKPHLLTTEPFPLPDTVKPWDQSLVFRYLAQEPDKC